ncbi:predicted protein [Pyrenophora tritici-repentis Pt-1C-BFP]|uniref:Uncharacterized protein n=1 Tax=Pyrenophora tritici-repentis (strain Pt-1C-BFP) TaxID=426418 RepID=B2VUB0_PYRTR|nr:uncharacterized protein PTRG_02083 [Pyrenophora tritici-repentis Pt-1C-BFP]EDU41521.1 predicted protein [Pyrenophora tritici-repentis Pt-1C-BFP]
MSASDVDVAPPAHKSSSHGRPLRKRARSAVEAEAALRKKQCTLAPTAANINPLHTPSPSHSEPYLRSPRKSQRLRDRPVAAAAATEGEVEAHSASYQPDARSIGNRTAALVNPSHNVPILSPPISSSSLYVAALDLDAVADVSKPTTRSQTSLKRTRTPSPRKTLRDLSMLNKPIEYVSSRSRLPLKTSLHWQALGSIYRDKDMIDHDADRKGVELKYETLLEIHAEAQQCADSGSHEAQWNTKTSFSHTEDETSFSHTEDETSFSHTKDETGFSHTEDETSFSHTKDETGFSHTEDETSFSHTENEHTVPARES